MGGKGKVKRPWKATNAVLPVDGGCLASCPGIPISKEVWTNCVSRNNRSFDQLGLDSKFCVVGTTVHLLYLALAAPLKLRQRIHAKNCRESSDKISDLEMTSSLKHLQASQYPSKPRNQLFLYQLPRPHSTPYTASYTYPTKNGTQASSSDIGRSTPQTPNTSPQKPAISPVHVKNRPHLHHHPPETHHP
jgi:hypothetical protein